VSVEEEPVETVPGTPAGTSDPESGAVARPGIAAWLERAVGRVWLLPALATLVLGAFQAGRPELWRDELRSWSAASRDLGDLFHLLGQTDAAVSLYYVILHGWISVFGDSALALRAPSVIAMAATAAMVGLIGRRLYNPQVGLVAGLLFAVIPNVSRFAQEVRPYALTLFLAGLSTLLLRRTACRSRCSSSCSS
jgi:mannosyltransferase